MTNRSRIPEVETLSEESRRLYDVLNNESDLACVLTATSYLDYALATLLKRHLIESSVVNRVLEPPRGQLSSFASRSDLAYCLGLIPKGLHKNLEIIGQIRNTFAHSYLSLELAAPELCQLIDLLIPPTIHHTITVDEDSVKHSGPVPMPLAGSPRQKFNTIVIMMVNRLLLTGLAKKHRPRQLKGWE